MDSIKDFFEDLKSRISNPFISAFILSWLMCNWKIPIAVIFNKEDSGYTSLIDFISNQLDFWISIVLPLGYALIYTFAFPYFKAFIRQHHTKITTKNDEEILNISKESVVPVERYLRLKENYETKLVEISKIALDESKLLETNAGLIESLETFKNETTRLTREINDANETVSRLKSWNDPTIIEGSWLISDARQQDRRGILTIRNGNTAAIIWDDSEALYEVRRFLGNHENMNIAFLLRPHEENLDSISFSFAANSNMKIEQLQGYMNNTFVELTRLKRETRRISSEVS